MTKLAKKFNYLRPLNAGQLTRLGNNKDGGYVVSNLALKKSDTLISFGLGDNFTFEKDFLTQRKGTKIYIYDHTVSYFSFLKKIYKTFKRMFYFKANFFDFISRVLNLINYFIFFKINDFQHIKLEVVSKISKSYQTNLRNIFNIIPSRNIVLSIDIEGGEYQIIRDLVKFEDRINLLIIEFHDTFILRKKFKKLILKLKIFFNIIHIHGNNYESIASDGLPIVLEFTFLNKKKFLINNKNFKKKFPIDKLDFPNVPSVKDYKINFY
jgi:hypothetical protein